jgi:hypothetical protein
MRYLTRFSFVVCGTMMSFFISVCEKGEVVVVAVRTQLRIQGYLDHKKQPLTPGTP